MITKTKTTCARDEFSAKAWRTVRLGDVATLQRGYDLPIEQMDKGEYPVIFSNGKIERHRIFKVKGPGVVTGRSGTLGGTFYITENYWPHNTTLYVNDFHGNEPRFVYYLFKTLDFSRLNAGSGVPTLNRNHVHEIEVSIPETADEQKRIAEILMSFDDKINNNIRIIKALEEMAQAIFKEWFVNFHFPGHEKAEFTDSPLGRIPKGWKVEMLRDVVELAYGKALKEENRKSGNVVVVGSSGIVGRHNEKLVGGPGIVVGRKGIAGSIIWIDDDFYPIDTTFYVKTSIPLIFCFFMLKQLNFISGDSAVPGLNRDDAYRIEMLLPEKKYLEMFEQNIESMFQQRRFLQVENQKLAATRDLLLPRLMSGEI